MRSFVVVHPHPAMSVLLCLGELFKLKSVQDVLPEGLVQSLHVALFAGFAFLDIVQFDVSCRILSPDLQCLRDAPGSVVDAVRHG